MIDTEENIDKAFNTVLLLLSFVILVGTYQIVFNNHFIFSRFLRVSGTFKNGQSYSQYLALLLPFIFAKLLGRNENHKKRIMYLLIFTLGLFNLFYSSTRIGWIAFALSIFVYCILAKKYKTLISVLLLFLIFIFSVSSFFYKFFGAIFTTPVSDYLSDFLSSDMKPNSINLINSIHTRVYVWKHMVDLVLKTNPILGLGSGTWFGYYSTKLNIPFASHNDYIQVLFGTGFSGLLFYLYFRIKQINLLCKIRSVTKNMVLNESVILPALSVYISFLFVSFTEVWQAYAGLYWTSWIMLGICECYYKHIISNTKFYAKI